MAKMRMSFGIERPSGPSRHYFDFPAEVRSTVENYTRNAISEIDPAAFQQEADYVAAVAARLIGTPYHGRYGRVVLKSTIVSSRGPKSAESWSGVDWIITATISDGTTMIEKAIVMQAKLGGIAHLSKREANRLQGQVEKMKKLTAAPKILEIPYTAGQREPRIVSGNGLVQGRKLRSIPLGRYLSSRVLTTLHGDTRPAFIQAAQDSRLTQLQIEARLTKQ